MLISRKNIDTAMIATFLLIITFPYTQEEYKTQLFDVKIFLSYKCDHIYQLLKH